MASQRDTVRTLLDLHGETFADELGIRLARPSPSALFQLLCAAILFSARISSDIASQAARNLRRAGWRSAQAMAASSWDDRVQALNRAGYTRYQERTATMLGDVAELVAERWGGDLRRLREEAERDPRRERALLKEVKGLGDVGVDIVFREIQLAWDELMPFADRRALRAAGELGLPPDAARLRRLAGGDEAYVRLVAALVRTALARDYDRVRRGDSGR